MRIESSVSASAVVPDLVTGAVAEVRVVSQEVQVRARVPRAWSRVDLALITVTNAAA